MIWYAYTNYTVYLKFAKCGLSFLTTRTHKVTMCSDERFHLETLICLNDGTVKFLIHLFI